MSFSTVPTPHEFSALPATEYGIYEDVADSLQPRPAVDGCSDDETWTSSQLRELGKAITGAHRA
nr:hypothetical protein [Rhodococcus sp. 05-2255-1e]